MTHESKPVVEGKNEEIARRLSYMATCSCDGECRCSYQEAAIKEALDAKDAEKSEIQEEANEMRKQRNLALDEQASLQSKLDGAVRTLMDLKYQHHHTIAEEMWRIDETLAKVKEEK